MKVGEVNEILKEVPNDAEFEINSVIRDKSWMVLEPTECVEMHYDDKRNKVFVTPFMVVDTVTSKFDETRDGDDYSDKELLDGSMELLKEFVNCYVKILSLQYGMTTKSLLEELMK